MPGALARSDLLDEQRGLTLGDNNGMWLELASGATLLGLDRPAPSTTSLAPRAADRLNAPHAFDFALRHLAVAGDPDQVTVMVTRPDGFSAHTPS